MRRGAKNIRGVGLVMPMPLMFCFCPGSEIFVRHRGPESMWTMHNAYHRSQFDVDTDYYYYDHSPSGRRQMYRLSSDGGGGQQPEPAAARPLRSGPVGLFDSRCIKWMLTIVSFVVFACKQRARSGRGYSPGAYLCL